MIVTYKCKEKKCLWREETGTGTAFCMMPTCPKNRRVRIVSFSAEEKAAARAKVKNSAYTDDEVRKIAELIKEGYSYARIGNLLGRTAQAIQKKALRDGIKTAVTKNEDVE